MMVLLFLLVVIYLISLKKIDNVLEISGLYKYDTDLRFRGYKLSLNMLHQLWCESGSNTSDSVRNVNKLTNYHFSKNNYSRMRVHLTAHIYSENIVNMIDNHTEECSGKEKYELLREVLLLLNNFIDIMNERKRLFFLSPNDKKFDEVLNFVSILFRIKMNHF